jgi:hypothetical protein
MEEIVKAKGRHLTGPPHTTRHAGPHRAVHEQGAHDVLKRSREPSPKDSGYSPDLVPAVLQSCLVVHQVAHADFDLPPLTVRRHEDSMMNKLER